MTVAAPYRTALIGFGAVAASLASDKKMAAHFKYATHAQVLADHPSFDWQAVVDPDSSARDVASARGDIAHILPDITGLEAACAPEVAILAIPPTGRLEILDALPSLKAIIVEKPLGLTLDEAEAFAARCRDRGLIVQVNLWRRADTGMRALADGDCSQHIGTPQAVTGTYGNGLLNNGTHMVDLIRLLCGDVTGVQALGPEGPAANAPLADDCALAGALTLANGTVATLQPLDFSQYREVGLDIWGARGRLEILQEGLLVRVCRRDENRGLEAEYEIVNDAPSNLPITAGDALYRLYDNLRDVLAGQSELFSPLGNALTDARIVDALRRSAAANGQRIPVAA